MKLTGINDTEAFRSAVLAQRDAVVEAARAGESTPSLPAGTAGADGVLVEIRDALLRIEERLGPDA